ncbi:Pvc16 family protein [Kribbella sp. CA-293567]|uniref:Pvc16 family protein n=1 Tax=Kribbella sp. CA-293567 TaxID=3002436 RepID=UPI0022DE506F|nr:Pvc16 family protein [Kribbella sp. CA-293567]WBQ06489.1 Pvc16 family protein [Kribbella sp. CA-293567]
MLDEVGAVIGAVLRGRLPAAVDVRQQAPRVAWQSEGTIVGLFLHRVRESRSQAATGLWTEDRDAEGRVVSRTSPERQYDLHYLVTAWAADPEQELALLGRILRTFANDPVVPASQLIGSLTGASASLTVSVGRDDRPPELWPALGLLPRTCLELVVTAPIPPVVRTELARPPENIELGVGVTGPPSRSMPGEQASRRPKARITEGEPDGPARGETR